MNSIFRTADRQQYKFPSTSANIDNIVALPKPNDIDIINIRSNKEFFANFIQQINKWFNWFDRFIDIFQRIIDWLKTHNVNRSNQILSDLSRIRDDPKMTLIEMRVTIDSALKLLQPFEDLQRLCQLFNCIIPFQIINAGTLNMQENTINILKELKRFQPNNTFIVDARKIYELTISIIDRQQVQWSLASDNHPCDITVEYRSYGTNNQCETLYEKRNVSIHKNVLHGQFETQRNGQLLITIDNKNYTNPRTVWYRIKSNPLSICHLFQGIFNMQFDKCYHQNSPNISEVDFSKLLGHVFHFINKLLNGDIGLRDMTELQPIFKDKMINIREEVKKLYINRSNEQHNNIINMPTTVAQVPRTQPNERDIEQVCEWLQIYQYYSHLNIIMECIEKFDILPKDNEEVKIGHLKRLSGNENCSLRDITNAYKILQDCFQTLTHQHLQLIKTVVECSNIIHMMKKADLYSQQGRRRFQELRDNLTTQFQLQELNNTILNSWIITYTLIEPFMFKANNFDDFVLRLAQITNLEESSLSHIKVTNDNMQLITMWLSAEETTVLDNALITMEHLYKSGTVDIHLQHLTREQSYYKIGYSIDRIQVGINTVRDENNRNQQGEENNRMEAKRIPFQLSMSDIDNHKRQLTFCNVDAQQNLVYKKALINGQLKLLQTIENIYRIFTKLELGGHPDYQLRDVHYEVHLQGIQASSMLTDLRTYQNAQLDNAIYNRIQSLELIYNSLKTTYDMWIENLKKYRQECSLLKLFSNREIMIIIILLRSSNAENSNRNRFLKKLFEFKNFKNQNEEEKILTIRCLEHYFRSLRIPHVNLTTDHLAELYQRHNIDAGSNTDVCLRKLTTFLKDILEHGGKIFPQEEIHDENEQFIVNINRPVSNPNQISFSNDFDLTICCILLNVFKNQLPSSYQILWCSNTTEEDIHLFFSRIQAFPSLTFVIMDIDKMHHRLREILLKEQDSLTRERIKHGRVFYFSRELTTTRKGLREFKLPAEYKNSQQSCKHLMNLFNERDIKPAEIQIIYGKAGIGKTHRINNEVKDDHTSCFSINDKLNVSLLISSFLLFDSKMTNNNPSIFFNISVHAPFEALNRTLFSLLICGCLNDPTSGLIFSLPHTQAWKFIIEVPYSDVLGVNVQENYNQILPILSIISPSTIEEVTDENYQLSIKKEEELVARFLKAFQDQTIDRMVTMANTGHEIPHRIIIDVFYRCTQSLFGNSDPLKSVDYQGKDYYAECLAWLIDIKYETFMKIVHETKFILTENFAYKLFHVHERKLTKLALIIEGDTGVGKTFLLKFYSLLLNSKITSDPHQGNFIPKIREHSNQFLLTIIETNIENQANVLSAFLQRIRPKVLGLENGDEDEAEILNQRRVQIPILPAAAQQVQHAGPIDDTTILYHIWTTILYVSTENATASIANLIQSLHDFVTDELVKYPLIGTSSRLTDLLQEVNSPSAETSIAIFKEYLFNCQIKPLFYRLLLHPGVTEEQLVEFMSPISQLARELPDIEIVVFFDEVNTASCLGLFKEMFMDGTLHGTSIPKNIFFTAAINPFVKIEENIEQVHRSNYIVHDFPQSLKDLKVSYRALESRTL
ncbi:unnamed protein product, partial [Rotaria sp. Silwood1]